MERQPCPSCGKQIPVKIFEFDNPDFMTLGKTFSKVRPCPQCRKNLFAVQDWDTGDVRLVRV